jgi:SAM-dependent methyltransferase
MNVAPQAMGCPYCGRADGVFVARKEPQKSVERFFRADFSQYQCPGCALYYCAPMTPDVRHGLDHYFAEFYNNKDRIYEPPKIVGETWGPSLVRDVLRSAYRRFRPQREFARGRTGEGMAILRTRGVKTLLDVGCSYGGFVRTALQHGIDAYGVEPNREVVSLIRKQGVDRIVAGFFPAETGPLPRYDAVTFFQVLMYLPDISPEFFIKCKNALNTGGMLLVFGTDPAQREAAEVELAMTVPLVVNFTGAEFMRRAAKDAGFANYEHVPCRGEPTSCFHILSV